VVGEENQEQHVETKHEAVSKQELEAIGITPED
jgi:hypothetical protein